MTFLGAETRSCARLVACRWCRLGHVAQTRARRHVTGMVAPAALHPHIIIQRYSVLLFSTFCSHTLRRSSRGASSAGTPRMSCMPWVVRGLYRETSAKGLVAHRLMVHRPAWLRHFSFSSLPQMKGGRVGAAFGLPRVSRRLPTRCAYARVLVRCICQAAARGVRVFSCTGTGIPHDSL